MPAARAAQGDPPAESATGVQQGVPVGGPSAGQGGRARDASPLAQIVEMGQPDSVPSDGRQAVPPSAPPIPLAARTSAPQPQAGIGISASVDSLVPEDAKAATHVGVLDDGPPHRARKESETSGRWCGDATRLTVRSDLPRWAFAAPRTAPAALGGPEPAAPGASESPGRVQPISAAANEDRAVPGRPQTQAAPWRSAAREGGPTHPPAPARAGARSVTTALAATLGCSLLPGEHPGPEPDQGPAAGRSAAPTHRQVSAVSPRSCRAGDPVQPEQGDRLSASREQLMLVLENLSTARRPEPTPDASEREYTGADSNDSATLPLDASVLAAGNRGGHDLSHPLTPLQTWIRESLTDQAPGLPGASDRQAETCPTGGLTLANTRPGVGSDSTLDTVAGTMPLPVDIRTEREPTALPGIGQGDADRAEPHVEPLTHQPAADTVRETPVRTPAFVRRGYEYLRQVLGVRLDRVDGAWLNRAAQESQSTPQVRPDASSTDGARAADQTSPSAGADARIPGRAAQVPSDARQAGPRSAGASEPWLPGEGSGALDLPARPAIRPPLTGPETPTRGQTVTMRAVGRPAADYALALSVPANPSAGPVLVVEGAAASGPDLDSTLVTLEEKPLADAIVRHLRLQTGKDGSEARLQLRPEYLGEVTVVLKVTGSSVTAVISAESATVRAWVEGHARELRDALSESGLSLDHLQVDPDGRQGNGQTRDETPPSPRPPMKRSPTDRSFEALL